MHSTFSLAILADSCSARSQPLTPFARSIYSTLPSASLAIKLKTSSSFSVGLGTFLKTGSEVH